MYFYVLNDKIYNQICKKIMQITIYLISVIRKKRKTILFYTKTASARKNILKKVNRIKQI